MQTIETIIAQTKVWILNVVVGCNFCPFAAREIKHGTIHYEVTRSGNKKACLEAFSLELQQLDDNSAIETSFLVFPDSLADFYQYLDMVELCEKLLVKSGYEGTYQLASFHPMYLFSGALVNDPANYTNRSPFPMIQVLREASITIALEKYPDPDKIPDDNIRFANQKGLAYMQALRASCMSAES